MLHYVVDNGLHSGVCVFVVCFGYSLVGFSFLSFFYLFEWCFTLFSWLY